MKHAREDYNRIQDPAVHDPSLLAKGCSKSPDLPAMRSKAFYFRVTPEERESVDRARGRLSVKGYFMGLHDSFMAKDALERIARNDLSATYIREPLAELRAMSDAAVQGTSESTEAELNAEVSELGTGTVCKETRFFG